MTLLIGCARRQIPVEMSQEEEAVSQADEIISQEAGVIFVTQAEDETSEETDMQPEDETPEESVIQLADTQLPVSAAAYCVMDAETGEVLLADQAQTQLAPASITKIVTAMAVAEHCQDLDMPVTVTEEMYADIDLLSSTVVPALRVGEVITIRDLLYGMALSSGNECASALAVATAGSVEQFAEWMNEIAGRTDAGDCHFVNAHGLDRDGHYVTALGMCRLWQAALQNE